MQHVPNNSFFLQFNCKIEWIKLLLFGLGKSKVRDRSKQEQPGALEVPQLGTFRDPDTVPFSRFPD